MRRIPVIVPLVCLLGLLLIPGCGKSKGEKIQVSGKVTVDGKPFKAKGYSLKFTRSGSESTTIAVNDDGSFSGEAITGPNDVELLAGGSGGHDPEGAKTGAVTYEVSSYAAVSITVTKGESPSLDFTKTKGGQGGPRGPAGRGGSSGGH